jgi:sulfur relay (sulfurtransferase) DsrF/TusC family protein
MLCSTAQAKCQREIDKDVDALMQKGVPVYVVTEDVQERGLVEHELVSGVQHLSRLALPKLLDQFDHVWRW